MQFVCGFGDQGDTEDLLGDARRRRVLTEPDEQRDGGGEQCDGQAVIDVVGEGRWHDRPGVLDTRTLRQRVAELLDDGGARDEQGASRVKVVDVAGEVGERADVDLAASREVLATSARERRTVRTPAEAPVLGSGGMIAWAPARLDVAQGGEQQGRFGRHQSVTPAAWAILSASSRSSLTAGLAACPRSFLAKAAASLS